MKVNKEMSKGSYELIILKLLSRQDMYGYQLVQQMSLLSEDLFCMSQGSLYPILHAMEKQELISSYTQVEKNRVRRFYHLTAAGRTEMADKEEQWTSYVQAMERILQGIGS